MNKKILYNIFNQTLCEDIINIIYNFLDKTCMQCGKILIENIPNSNYKRNILYYNDNLWCDMKNDRWVYSDVCNWCYYYVWRHI